MQSRDAIGRWLLAMVFAALIQQAGAQTLDDVSLMVQGEDMVARVSFFGSVRLVQQSPITPTQFVQFQIELLAADEAALDPADRRNPARTGNGCFAGIHADAECRAEYAQEADDDAVERRHTGTGAPGAESKDDRYRSGRQGAASPGTASIRQTLRRQIGQRSGECTEQPSGSACPVSEPRGFQYTVGGGRHQHVRSHSRLFPDGSRGRGCAQSAIGAFSRSSGAGYVPAPRRNLEIRSGSARRKAGGGRTGNGPGSLHNHQMARRARRSRERFRPRHGLRRWLVPMWKPARPS